MANLILKGTVCLMLFVVVSLDCISCQMTPHVPVVGPVLRSNVFEILAAGTYSVTESNVTCIIITGTITLSLNYTDVYNVSRLTQLEIPAKADSTGSCGGGRGKAKLQQSIILTWMQPNGTQPHGLNNTFTMEFHANVTKSNSTSGDKEIPLGKYALVKVNAVIHKDPSLFPNATNPEVPFVVNLENLAMFPTPLNNSYACQSVSSFDGMGPAEDRVQLTVLLTSIQIEAFRRTPDSMEFSSAQHCAADAIGAGSIVGTIIVTLVVIVLIALGVAALATFYLKKKRAAAGQSGYENM